MGGPATFGTEDGSGPLRSPDSSAGRRRRKTPRPAAGRRARLPLAGTGSAIPLDASGPAQPSTIRSRRLFAALLALAITGVAVASHYSTVWVLIPAAWLAVGPLLASLLLSPPATAMLAGWTVLLGAGVIMDQPRHPENLASRLGVLVLLAAFAIVNSVLRSAAQRRLSQVRAVARVAQSAVLSEVPATVAAGRLASRYISAAAEARVGGDLLEVVPDGGAAGGHPRWLVGDTRGKGLPAVRLASVAMTSFRDACAQPGLSLPEIARAVDRSVARAAGDEDFVTAVFAEFDPRGWLQLVVCGHPPPFRLAAEDGLRALSPNVYATPLGLQPDIHPTTFSVSPGDRLVFYTDGLLEARDRAGRYFRLEECLDTLRQPDLEQAADELLGKVIAHTGRRLEDDVAVLLFEATSPPAPAGTRQRADEPSSVTGAR
jgi:sigma-B regulation protein RsbU (phosphoserine phosphatase)